MVLNQNIIFIFRLEKGMTDRVKVTALTLVSGLSDRNFILIASQLTDRVPYAKY